MPRYFTKQQAEEILPEIESIIRGAISLKTEHYQADAALQDIAQRIAVMGGMQVDREKFAALQSRRETSAHRLKDAIEKIQTHGCVLKDLDVGLLDFPTLLHGEEVYLCWKLGERAIEFWHGIQEGFAGRKRIDRDFLENHEGEQPN